jgi:hypothetical protein
VDGAIENIDIPEVDLSQITEPTITLNTGFLSVKNQAGNETQFEVNPSVAGFSVPVIYTDNAFRPTQETMLVNKAYVDEEIKDAVDDIDLTPYLKKDGSVLITNTLNYETVPALNDAMNIPNLGYVDSQDQARLRRDGSDAMTGNLNLGSNKIEGLINGVLESDCMTKGYIDGQDSVLQGAIDSLETSKIS